MASKIEQELVEMCGAKPYKSGDRQAFLRKLTGEVDKLEDDDWGRLSTKAQDWQNAATEAVVEHKTDIEDFPDAEVVAEAEEVEEEQEDEGVQEEVEEAAADSDSKPSKRAKENTVARTATKIASNGKAANTPAKDTRRRQISATPVATKPAKATKAKATKPRERHGEGAHMLIARMLIKDPNITTKQVVEQLSKKGRIVTPGAANAIRYHQVTALRIANELGHTKGIDF